VSICVVTEPSIRPGRALDTSDLTCRSYSLALPRAWTEEFYRGQADCDLIPSARSLIFDRATR
jgi:hypothetical protein